MALFRFALRRIPVWGLVAALALAPTLYGCADHSPYIYSGAQVNRAQDVSYATVVGMRPVSIQQSGDNSAGALFGGMLGGMLGGLIGGNSGHHRHHYYHSADRALFGAALGALAGAGLGYLAQDGLSHEAGFEIQLRGDDGREFSVVQQAAGSPFYPGERVRLLTGPDGMMRITR